MLFSFQHSSGLYEQFPRPLRTPHAAQLPAIATRCDVFGTSQACPQNPSCASLIHLQGHHRNICTHDLIEQAFHVLRMQRRREGVEDEKIRMM